MKKNYNKELESFLKKGGMLLRRNINCDGEYIVEKLSINEGWEFQFSCKTPEICDIIIEKLIADHPTRFRAVKMNSECFAMI